ncbi:unnamed protein product [Calypogeia fissa]
MKMGSSMVVGLVMAMTLMVGSVQQGAQAQSPAPSPAVSLFPYLACLPIGEFEATVSDAMTVAQTVSSTGGECCQTSSVVNATCTVLYTFGTATAAICAPVNFCLSCTDVGNVLTQIVTDCSQGNLVGGELLLDSSGDGILLVNTTAIFPPPAPAPSPVQGP